ncbi:MAG: dihydrodipicolinate reductase [Actinobacteria bacterium]|nr:dihydrodipicolinate reductase [Actinomycetota bacterium]
MLARIRTWRWKALTTRVVVWGTGLVGSMVIAEIVRHPAFELVGVGVHDPAKVGRDAGELSGIGPIGVTATDDVAALIASAPDGVAHYGPTAAHPEANIATITAFLRAGIDVVSTAMTPWVWPWAPANPPEWIAPIEAACDEGGTSCFTTGIDPGFANDLFPLTLMGLCAQVRSVTARELLDYTDYTGDYATEMGFGHPADHRPILSVPEVLILAWGGTVPLIAHAAGVHLDAITTTWDTWVTDHPIDTAVGTFDAGTVAAVRFTINGVVDGVPRVVLEHVNRVGVDTAPEWPRGNTDDVYQVLIDGSPSITQETAIRFTDGSSRSPAVAGCLATGMRALNALPAVIAARPGFVTPLDLPLVPGVGTIR